MASFSSAAPFRAWLLPGLLALATNHPGARAQEISSRTLRDWQFYNNTGWLALRKGDLDTAERRFHRAVEIIRPYEAGNQRLLARSYSDLAWVLYREKRYAESEPLAKWSLSVRETHPKTKPDHLAQGLYLMAVIHRARHHTGESEPLLKRALAIKEKVAGMDNPETAIVLDELAGVETELGKYDEAEPFYKRALAIRERYNPSENLELAETLEHYVAFLHKIRREVESRAFEDQAKAIRDAVAARAARGVIPAGQPPLSPVR